MTLEEAWSGRKPAVDYFRIFGCIAYAHVLDKNRKKLDNKVEKCVFLGVSESSKAYKVFNPVTKKVVVSRDVSFDGENTWDWKVQQPTQALYNGNIEEEQLSQPSALGNSSVSAQKHMLKLQQQGLQSQVKSQKQNRRKK